MLVPGHPPFDRCYEALVAGVHSPVMALKLVLAVAILGLMAACELPGSQPSCSKTMIDWVNFIQVGSTQYVSGPEADNVAEESALGPAYAYVKFKVNGNVCDPGYKLKDGDAAFLDPGTPIYQVKGQPAAEQLAARFNGTLVVYRAMTPVR